MKFSRQEYWSGYPVPSPGDLPDPDIKLRSSACRWLLYFFTVFFTVYTPYIYYIHHVSCILPKGGGEKEEIASSLNWTEMLLFIVQLCLTLCNPMDCSPPGSSVHEISQVRILEWVAISFSRTKV